MHALLGENGAGKTTLTRIIYGLSQPDSGELRIGGVATRITSPKEAMAAGIGVVTQEFSLVGPMTVTENVMLAAVGLGAVDRRRSPECRRGDRRADRRAHRSRRSGRAAVGRRAPAGRDHQGAASRLPGADPRRTDRRARPPSTSTPCSARSTGCAPMASASCSSPTSCVRSSPSPTASRSYAAAAS